jgi:hypothetical protein
VGRALKFRESKRERCIESERSYEDGLKLRLGPCDADLTHRVHVESAADGAYYLLTGPSGKRISVARSSRVDGAAIEQVAASESDTWQLRSAFQGGVRLVNRHSGLCLSAPDRKASATAPLRQLVCASDESSTWFPEVPRAVSGIEWDLVGRRTVSPSTAYSAAVPRAVTLRNGTVLLSYHYARNSLESGASNIAVLRSTDGGSRFGEPIAIELNDDPVRWGFRDASLIELDDEQVLVAYTGVGWSSSNANHDLRFKFSSDHGATWSDTPLVIPTGRIHSPRMLQLPNGELHVYYASEARWENVGADNLPQEIMLRRSHDRGKTWSEETRIVWSGELRRDGMESPLLLAGGRGIALAFETVRGAHSPSIAWSGLDQAWFGYGSLPEEEGGPPADRRWPTSPLWGGAPGLAQLLSGETVIVFQTDDGRAGRLSWENGRALVFVGDAFAKRFARSSEPWPGLPLDEGTYHSFILVRTLDRITLFTSHRFGQPQRDEVVAIDGTVLRE